MSAQVGPCESLAGISPSQLSPSVFILSLPHPFFKRIPSSPPLLRAAHEAEPSLISNYPLYISPLIFVVCMISLAPRRGPFQVWPRKGTAHKPSTEPGCVVVLRCPAFISLFGHSPRVFPPVIYLPVYLPTLHGVPELIVLGHVRLHAPSTRSLPVLRQPRLHFTSPYCWLIAELRNSDWL